MTLRLNGQDADPRTEHLAVEDQLTLTATQTWVHAPAALLLPQNGRTFEILVRFTQSRVSVKLLLLGTPTQLAPHGCLHLHACLVPLRL